MHGDFSRITFRPDRHFSRVLWQQGCVQLDAELNEHGAIPLHFLRALGRDLFGPHAGPKGQFKVDYEKVPPEAARAALWLNKSGRAEHYYVNGIVCENEQTIPIAYVGTAPLGMAGKPELVSNNEYLIYLDAWERHVTSIQYGSIREVALGGPPTTTRARVEWRVRVVEPPEAIADPKATLGNYDEFVKRLNAIDRPTDGRLAARARKPAAEGEDQCLIPPSARYRGHENQLYRIEIRKSGEAGADDASKRASFVWSRDNGSVAAPWVGKDGDKLLIDGVAKNGPLGFSANHWVELTADEHELLRKPGILVPVLKVEDHELTIDPTKASEPIPMPAIFGAYPKVRRWDSAGEIPVEVPAKNEGWLPLEDGIAVRFEKGKYYRSGDYWLIPARTATGDIEWPRAGDPPQPAPRPPDGVEHFYAPLAYIKEWVGGDPKLVDLRWEFESISKPAP